MQNFLKLWALKMANVFPRVIPGRTDLTLFFINLIVRVYLIIDGLKFQVFSLFLPVRHFVFAF